MAIVKRRNKAGVSFQVKLRDKWGYWYQSTTFSDLTEATRFHDELLKLKEQGLRASQEHTGIDGSKITALSTFNELVNEWKIECRAKVSRGWQISQDQMLRDYILPVIQSRVINEIEPRDISNVLASVSNMGRKPATVKHVYVLLRDIFSDAIEHFGCRLERNPVLRRYKPELLKTERTFLKPHEALSLLRSCADKPMGPAIWIGILAGLRPCEIQALTWNKIDWEFNEILISTSFSRKEKKLQNHTKQKDWGRTPMPEPLRLYLFPRRKEPGAFVCLSPRGKMLPYVTFNKHLKAECKLAGVTEITPHELRHSSTEMWVEEQASQTDVQRMLNHKSISSTAVYMHRTNTRLHQIAKNVGRPLLTIVGGNTKNVPEQDSEAAI